MKQIWKKVLSMGLAIVSSVSVAGTAVATEIENGAAVAGFSVNLNNYYASSYTPEDDILEYLGNGATQATVNYAELPTVALIPVTGGTTVEGTTNTVVETVPVESTLTSGTTVETVPVITPSTQAASAEATNSVTSETNTTAESVESNETVVSGEAVESTENEEENTVTTESAQMTEAVVTTEKGIVSVLGNLNIRKEPSTSSEILGNLYSNCQVEISEFVSNEEGDWYAITSNGISGYVNAKYILTGEEAELIESNISNKVAIVTAELSNVRDTATVDGAIIDTVYQGERYAIQQTQGDYVKLLRDGYAIGYVPLADIKMETQLPAAVAVGSVTAEVLTQYLSDLDYTKTVYIQRMTNRDYAGAWSAAAYLVELWGMYLNEVTAAGLSDVVAEAEAERNAAIELMNAASAKKAEQDALNPTVAPSTEAAVETTPASTVPAETTAAPTVPVETAPPTPTVEVIEAFYTGGTKYAGDMLYRAEFYLMAKYSDGTFATIRDGWWSGEIGMYLAEGQKVVTLYYDNLSCTYVVPVLAAPAAPAPAPTAPAPAPAPVVPSRDYRTEIVNYALSWVGRCNYVWGGTTLVPGGAVDCSGFTLCVYRDVAGISLPHYSGAQLSCGAAISYEQLRPGDLVLYSGHVAIYIGNGMIVHAKSAQAGIVTDSVFFNASQPPIGYRTLLP